MEWTTKSQKSLQAKNVVQWCIFLTVQANSSCHGQLLPFLTLWIPGGTWVARLPRGCPAASSTHRTLSALAAGPCPNSELESHQSPPGKLHPERFLSYPQETLYKSCLLFSSFLFLAWAEAATLLVFSLPINVRFALRCDFGVPFFWLPGYLSIHAMILSSCLEYVREFLEEVVKSLEAKKQKSISRMWYTLVPSQSRSQKYISVYPFSGSFQRTLRKRSIGKEGKGVRKIPQGEVMALSAVHSQKIFLLEYKQWIVKIKPRNRRKFNESSRRRNGEITPRIATAKSLFTVALKEQRS